MGRQLIVVVKPQLNISEKENGLVHSESARGNELMNILSSEGATLSLYFL
ncbi:hypothetical protein SAMN04487969_15113 [Paenibacillus algorifonticola]|uniref:Uncharacterized protein n=1 Tax=Paenibacillus algorifonticola TaxID=684063 RepID=A0A1I2J193_9BACL|nr:hypothetical protein [Paenibacillus algorifonticola]SFF48502.1 hypothetical protein SAMN04487969_15113 [Paenibacillus algorifonticola]